VIQSGRPQALMMRVGTIVVPGFDVMSFAPLSVFDAANITLGEQR
jgi:hypothetical protein